MSFDKLNLSKKDDLAKYIRESTDEQLLQRDPEGKNIFNYIADLDKNDDRQFLIDELSREKRYDLLYTNGPIPEWFYVEKNTSDSLSPDSKFDPVLAASSGSGWGSSISSLSLNKKSPKTLIIDKRFFDVDEGEYKEKVINRKIFQVNKLKKEGFTIIFPSDVNDKDLVELEEDLTIEFIENIGNFDNKDYDILESKFSVPKKNAVLLNNNVANELNTLFVPKSYILNSHADLESASICRDDVAISIHLGQISGVRDFIDKNKESLDKYASEINTYLYHACSSGCMELVELLLSTGKVDFGWVNSSGLTAFHKACQKGYTQIAELLLKKGAEPDFEGDVFVSAIYAACSKGYTKILSLLLNNGVDLRISHEVYATLLHTACVHKQIETAKFLIENIGFAHSNKFKGCSTPLQTACILGQKEIVELLVQHGDDIYLKRVKDGATPLQLACRNGHEGVAEFLLSKGAKLDPEHNSGDLDALQAACSKGYLEILKLLSKNGTKFDVVHEKFGTLLHTACETGNVGVIGFLLEKNSYIDLNELSNGFTPLQIACEFGHEEAMRLLLESGADFRVIHGKFGTLLHFACRRGHAGVVRLLLKKAIDNDSIVTNTDSVAIDIDPVYNGINSTDCEHKFTPLLIACHFGHEEIVKFLLQEGANWGATSEDGTTALHLACNIGNEKIVDLLLQEGGLKLLLSSVNRDIKVTPLYMACGEGHKDIVIKLIEFAKQNLGAESAEFKNFLLGADSGHVFKHLTTVGTAKSIAWQNGHNDIVEILEESGERSWKSGRALLPAGAITIAASVTVLVFALKILMDEKELWSDRPQDSPAHDHNPEGYNPHSDVATYAGNYTAEVISSTVIPAVIRHTGAFDVPNEQQPEQLDRSDQPQEPGQIFQSGRPRKNTLTIQKGRNRDYRRDFLEYGRTATYHMDSVAQRLNNDDGPTLRVRTAVQEIFEFEAGDGLDHGGVALRDASNHTRAENVDYTKYLGFINKEDYEHKDPDKDGEFYHFGYHEESRQLNDGTYETKLLSVRRQDQIEILEPKGEVEILDMYKGSDGFYRIITSAKASFDYLFNTPSESNLPDVEFDQRIKNILSQYNENKRKAGPNAGDFKFPRSDYANNEEWLSAIFASGGGSCQDRVRALDYKFKEAGIDESIYDIIEIDGNHVALEIGDQYYDLGGTRANMIYDEKDLRDDDQEGFCDEEDSLFYTAASTILTVTSFLAGKVANRFMSGADGNEDREVDREVDLEQGDVHEEMTNIKNKSEISLCQYLKTSAGYKEIDDFSEVLSIKKEPSLVIAKNIDKAANRLIRDLRSKGRKVLYIDSPKKVDIFDQVLSLEGDSENPHIKESGFLESFIKSISPQENGPVIIFNWDNIDETTKVTLNTVLDEKSTIQGLLLRGIQVIGLSGDESTDSSFISRQTGGLYEASEELETEISSAEQESQELLEKEFKDPLEIDFQGFTNWQAVLFGSIDLVNNEPILQKSKFLKALQSGADKFEFKNLPPSVKKEFEYELAKAKAFGYFTYQGKKISISDKLNIQFSSKLFDFSKFANSSDVKLATNKNFDQVPESIKIVNTKIFDGLIHDKEIKEDGTYNQRPGSIEQASETPDRKLQLFITSNLSTEQLYCLLDRAREKRVKLELFCAPNVIIPKELEGIDSPDSDIEISKPKSRVIITNDSEQYLKENTPPDTIVIDVENHSYQDLVQSETFEIRDGKFQNFQRHKSQIIEKLERGQKIIIKGVFSPDLLQMLQGLMIDPKICNNLTIIAEQESKKLDGSLPSQFAWIGEGSIEVGQYPPSEKPSIPTLEESDANPELTENSKNNSDTFITKRKLQLEELLKKSPIVRLSGESGIGKTSLVHEYTENVYNDFSELKSWAENCEGDDEKILLIKAAKGSSLTMLRPMLRDKDNELKTIFYKGEIFNLTKNHKVVIESNDLECVGSIMNMKDFPADYIYEKLLLEEVFYKVDFDKIKISIEERSTLEEKFKKACKGFIKKYQQVNQRHRDDKGKGSEETVRELQSYALDFISKETSYPTKHEKIKSDSYISTDATKSIEDSLRSCLSINSQQKSRILPAIAGLGGIFLEGGSGIGKSSLIESILNQSNIKYHKIDASMPLDQKIKIITTAFEEGEAVWIDELNSCMGGGFKEFLKSVLEGRHPQTGKPSDNPGFLLIASSNKASMDGRDIIDKETRHMLHCPKVPDLRNFKVKDVTEILDYWFDKKTLEQDEISHEENGRKRDLYTTQEMAIQFCKLLEQGQELNLRDLKCAFNNIYKEMTIVPSVKDTENARDYVSPKVNIRLRSTANLTLGDPEWKIGGSR